MITIATLSAACLLIVAAAAAGLLRVVAPQERQKLDTDVTKQQQQPDGGGESAGGEASATAKAAGAGRLLMPRGLQPEAAAVFHSSSARALYDALFRSHAAARRSLAREAFAPRRTAFVYEFMDGAGDVPTTLRRSKADCPAAEVWKGVARLYRCLQQHHQHQAELGAT